MKFLLDDAFCENFKFSGTDSTLAEVAQSNLRFWLRGAGHQMKFAGPRLAAQASLCWSPDEVCEPKGFLLRFFGRSVFAVSRHAGDRSCC